MLKRILPLVFATTFIPNGAGATNVNLSSIVESRTNLICPISEKGVDIVYKTINERLKTMESEAKLMEQARLEEEERIRQERSAQELAQQKARELEQKRIAEESKFEIKLTFYTSLDCENGYGAITCTGERFGGEILLASNYYPIGTIVDIEGYGRLRVADRGGSSFNSSNRFDVYIPREQGESEGHYYKRVNNMGVVNTRGRIVD